MQYSQNVTISEARVMHAYRPHSPSERSVKVAAPREPAELARPEEI